MGSRSLEFILVSSFRCAFLCFVFLLFRWFPKFTKEVSSNHVWFSEFGIYSNTRVDKPPRTKRKIEKKTEWVSKYKPSAIRRFRESVTLVRSTMITEVLDPIKPFSLQRSMPIQPQFLVTKWHEAAASPRQLKREDGSSSGRSMNCQTNEDRMFSKATVEWMNEWANVEACTQLHELLFFEILACWASGAFKLCFFLHLLKFVSPRGFHVVLLSCASGFLCFLVSRFYI